MQRKRQGFTLIEMIVVMGIIALVTTITVVAFAPFFRTKALGAASARVQTAVTAARAYAINYACQVRLVFDTNARQMQLLPIASSDALAQPINLPANLTMQATFPVTVPPSGQPELVFTPTGTLSGNHTGDATITINPPQGAPATLWVLKASGLCYSEE